MTKEHIDLSAFLKRLYRDIEEHNAYKLRSEKLIYEPLTCAKLAELCEVTPATLSNLSTYSKYALLKDIAVEIHYYYYDYFTQLNFYNMAHPCEDGSFTYYSDMYILDLLTWYY